MQVLELLAVLLADWWDGRKKRKQQEAHMERTGGDQCCPFCDTWASEMGGWAGMRTHPTRPELDLLKCKFCDEESAWVFAMGMHLVEPQPKTEERGA